MDVAHAVSDYSHPSRYLPCVQHFPQREGNRQMEHPGTLEEAIALIEQLRARVLQLEEENDLLALGNSRLLAELDEARTQARPAAKQAEQAAHGGLLPEDEHLLQEGDRGYVTDRKATLENASAGTNVTCIRLVDDERIVYGGVDKHLRVFNVNTQLALGAYELPAPPLSIDVFHDAANNEHVVLCGCMDGSHHLLRLSHLQENRFTQPDESFHDHRKYVSSVKFSFDGSMFAVASHDKSVTMYRKTDEGRYELAETLRVVQAVEAVEFVHVDGQESVAIAMRENPYLLYVRTSDWQQTKVSVNEADWDAHVSFSILFLHRSPCGRYLLAATDKSRHIVYAVGTNRIVRNLYGHTCTQFSNPRAVWDHSGRYVYCNSEADNKIHVYSIAAETIVHSIDAHNKLIRDLAIHPTLRMLATASYDRSVSVWANPAATEA